MTTTTTGGPSLITIMTSPPSAGFQWSEAYPAMIGAAIGGLVAVLVAVGTQVWQASQARRHHREQQVLDATVRLLEVLGDIDQNGWPRPTAVTSTGLLLRGTAKRAGYPKFDEVLTAFIRPGLAAYRAQSYDQAAKDLVHGAVACQWWLEDPQVFDRRRSPRTVEDVRAAQRTTT